MSNININDQLSFVDDSKTKYGLRGMCDIQRKYWNKRNICGTRCNIIPISKLSVDTNEDV